MIARLPMLMRLLPVVLVALAGICPPAQSAPEPAPQPESSAVTADLASPRAVLSSFLKAMNAVTAGQEDAWPAALACIYLDEVQEGQRIREGRDLAYRLYNVLDKLTLDVEAVPDSSTQRDVRVELGKTGQVALFFRRYDDDQWRISYSRLQEHLPAYEEAVSQPAGDTSQPDTPGVADLKSPRAAMRAFIEGMNNWRDGGIDRALKTFDLSEVDVGVRREIGTEYAYKLKQVLDRDRVVIYQNIPDAPDGPPYTHLTHPAGNIVIGPLENPETGAREWKFTANTLAQLTPLYDAFKDRPRVAGTEDPPAPMSLMLRDWVDARAPFLLERTFYLENYQWLGLLGIIFLGMAISRLLTGLIRLALRRWFRRKQMTLDRTVEGDFIKPIRIAFMAWVWLLGLSVLGLPAKVFLVLLFAARAVSAAAGVWAVFRLIDIIHDYLAEHANRTANKFDNILVPLVTRTLKVFTLVVGIVFVTETLGIELTTLLAGLGLGGLAFALAAKDTVSNVFGSLTILFDRPFEIGDWVIIDGTEGCVETVGIRSTRIRTFYNSLISVPNANLISAVIDNMGSRRFRRFRTMLAITYDTPPERIEAFCEGIRELIRRHPYTRKDYFQVYLNEFGESSLNVLLYCFHETPDWSTELRERERLMLDVIRLAGTLGVEFAFPTHTLYMHRDGSAGHHVPAPVTDAAAAGTQAADTVLSHQATQDAPPPPVQFDRPAEATSEDMPILDAEPDSEPPRP